MSKIEKTALRAHKKDLKNPSIHQSLDVRHAPPRSPLRRSMFFTRLLTRLNDVCNRLGSNGNIAQIQSRNADAAVANAVDGMLFTKHIHFFRRKTREGEHALLTAKLISTPSALPASKSAVRIA